MCTPRLLFFPPLQVFFPAGGEEKLLVRSLMGDGGERRDQKTTRSIIVPEPSAASDDPRRRGTHMSMKLAPVFSFHFRKKRKVTARAFPRCFNVRRRQTKKLNPEREDLFPFSKFPPFQLPLLSALIESAMRGGSFIDEKISPSPPTDKPPACGGRRGASVRCALEEGIGGGRGIEGEKSRMMCYANYTLSLLSRRMEEGRRAGGGGGGREQRCTTHTQASKEHSLLIQGPPPPLSSPSLPLCQVD